MKHLTPYLQNADEFLREQHKKVIEKDNPDNPSLFNLKGEIEGEYPPFAASFGAAIIRSGLLPAIFLYAEESGGGKSKIPLNKLILYIIEGEIKKESLKDYVIQKIYYKSDGTEQDEKTQKVNTFHLQKKILNATIAAKLALRTYPVAGKNNRT